MRPTARLTGVAGIIDMEDNVKATTVKFITGLVTSDKAAVIFTLPIATPVATPTADTVAILISELTQVTLFVISADEPSAYVAVAINSFVEPTPKFSGAVGVTAMDDKAGAGTIFKATTGLVLPETVAMMLVVPSATPVAIPAEDIVAILVSEVVHTTLDVISAVEPFVYVPVAVNCMVNPTAKLGNVAGVTAIEDKVAVGVVVDVDVVLDVDVDEQDAITVISTIIIAIVRQLIKNRICFLFIVLFLYKLLLFPITIVRFCLKYWYNF